MKPGWKYNLKNAELVQERRTLKVLGSGSCQSGSQLYGTSGAAKRVNERSPHLSEVKQIHAQMVECGNGFRLSEKNALIDLYLKYGSLVDARHVFNNMPKRNLVSWNMMILGYAKQEECVLAFELYSQMQQEGVQPCERTFVAAFKACTNMAAVEKGKQVAGKSVKVTCLEKGRLIHAQAMKSGFASNVFVGNILVDMYAKCGSMEDARHAFDMLSHRDLVSWNTMMLGYSQEEGALALELYAQMYQEGVIPDHRTFVGALKACSGLAAFQGREYFKIGCLQKGRAIHSQAVNSGFESDVFVGTTLVDMYVKYGIMEDARHVFDKLPTRDGVSWTAMIFGYAQMEEGELALELYTRMHGEGVLPHHRTFVGALKACSTLAVLEEGKQVGGKFVKLGYLEKGRGIHSQALKSRFELDVFVGTTLVDMYAKCGCMEDARHVFDELPHRNVVSWNNIILGYAEQEESEEALKLYEQMQEQSVSADHVTFVSILKALGNIAALEGGKDLHVQVCSVGLETTANVSTTLIDMYAKCGSMIDAQQLFDALPTRDLVTWNALISGYARQGESEHVFCLFEKMRREGMKPNGSTFLSVLNVCSHVGLLDKGQEYFQAMSQYGIILTVEHYTCMIDLLGRRGQVEAAVEMVRKMPFQPDIVIWLSVLGACRKWKNIEVGRHAFKQAVKLDDKDAAAYVLMSNIYAHAHMWEDRDKIQAMRKNVQAWKKPGQSWWTDMDGRVHTFVVGDRRHPQAKDIYDKLGELSIKMKEQGYMPSLDFVLQEISDDEKEDALCGHSEKLAIACALINTPERTPIRVVKNLRVCDDCHKVTALISKIERRNIICRDASRFHSFVDGKCSCGDFW